MDPQQPVVLQLLESLKESYMSNDFKTCQQLLGQLKDIVDQKANGTNNQEPKLPLVLKSADPNHPQEEENEQLGESNKLPLVMKYLDPNLWDEEDAEDEQDAELDDYSKMPYDREWITKTNCVEGWKEKEATIDNDEKEDEEDAKEDEEEEDAKEDEEEEEDAKEDEEEKDAKEDEDVKVDKEEDSDDAEYVVDEDEDDDSGAEEDEDIHQPLRRSSRIKNANK